MVSKRNLFSIITMMMIVLFMFQFSQILKENSRDYKTNRYSKPWLVTMEGKWTKENTLDSKTVVLMGDSTSQEAEMVKQWCDYAKYHLETCKDVSRYIESEEVPYLLLVNGAEAGISEQSGSIVKMAKKGVPIVFITMPPTALLQSDDTLRDLLGIEEIRTSQVILSKEQLFDGFLLGGGKIYEDSPNSALRLNDLSLSVPWIITGEGTKSYMIGTVKDREFEDGECPRILWRNRYRNTMVFAINGNFAKDECLFGILSGFVYEFADYTIYPVVNGQNVMVKNFPTFTSENEEKLRELYSRNSMQVEDDILWPELLSLSVKHSFKPTIYFSTKYDYSDPQSPSNKRLMFYLQQVAEANGEAGRGLSYKGEMNYTQKALQDMAFYNGAKCPYAFSSGYVIDFNEELKQALEDRQGLTEVQTITGNQQKGEPIFYYYQNGVTKQCITADLQDYTFREDFRARCLLTSLGYMNLSVDFHSMIWPITKDDQIQNYFGKMVGYMDNYWSDLLFLETTTVSQCDSRIRSMLEISYRAQINEEDRIFLQIDNMSDNVWFILRTHGKQVAQVYGGTATKIEDDAYLIRAQYSDCQIFLEESDSLKKFTSPFKELD